MEKIAYWSWLELMCLALSTLLNRSVLYKQIQCVSPLLCNVFDFLRSDMQHPALCQENFLFFLFLFLLCPVWQLDGVMSAETPHLCIHYSPGHNQDVSLSNDSHLVGFEWPPGCYMVKA